MVKDEDISLAFHYLFDGTKNCYLIGARLTGSPEAMKNAVLNGNKLEMQLEQLVKHGLKLDLGITRFVPAGMPEMYHTEKLFEVGCQPAELGNPFSRLRARIIANNVLILQYTLLDKMEK